MRTKMPVELPAGFPAWGERESSTVTRAGGSGVLSGARGLFLSYSAAAWNALASSCVSYSSEMSLFV